MMARAPFTAATAHNGPDGAAPCKFGLQPEPLKLSRHMPDDRIGVAGGTVDRQQRLELVDQIGNVDLQS